MKVTKDMTVQQVLDIDQGTVPVFLSFGLTCLGCPMSRMETIEQACGVHGIDADALMLKLNEYFEQ